MQQNISKLMTPHPIGSPLPVTSPVVRSVNYVAYRKTKLENINFQVLRFLLYPNRCQAILETALHS